MIAIFYLALQILKLYSYVVIANVIISWLIAFNILNTQNRFVYSILELTYKLTEPLELDEEDEESYDDEEETRPPAVNEENVFYGGTRSGNS